MQEGRSRARWVRTSASLGLVITASVEGVSVGQTVGKLGDVLRGFHFIIKLWRLIEKQG